MVIIKNKEYRVIFNKVYDYYSYLKIFSMDFSLVYIECGV